MPETRSNTQKSLSLIRCAALALAAAVLSLLCASGSAGAATLAATPLPYAGETDDLIVGPDGALWFAGRERDEIDRFDPASGALQRFPIPSIEEEGEREGPTDLTAGADGKVWYLTGDGREVGRISTAGSVEIVSPLNFDVFLGHIAAAPGGGVWESVHSDFEGDTEHEVRFLSENGATITKYPYESTYVSGGPIATAADGAAWIGDWGVSITRISPAGIAPYPTGYPSSTEEINSIAFAPDGATWYAGFSPSIFAAGEGGFAYAGASGGVIGRIAPGGTPQAVRIGTNTLTGSISSGGDGSMWFAVGGGVGRIDPSGAYQLGGTAPYQPGTATSPGDLVYGPAGAVWFIDSEHAALVRVTVDGSLFPPPPAPPAPAPAPAPPAPPKPSAPRAKVQGKQVLVRTIEKRRGIPLSCAMAGAGTCKVTALIAAKDAKKLRLKVPKKAKVLTLGRASSSFKKAASQKLFIRLPRKVLRGLDHLRGGVTLILRIATSAPGATGTRAVEELTLKN